MHRTPLPASLVLFLSVVIAAEAQADIITPAGLNPGDQFRIVFVTSTTRDATSSMIGDYDAFVTDAADTPSVMFGPNGLSLYNGNPVTWQVIGSTASVSAISRLPLTSPALFLPTGGKVADSGTDLWDGGIDQPITTTELGLTVSDKNVWTGTADSGGNVGFPLGVLFAQQGTADASIIDARWVERFTGINSTPASFYGFSSVLTVPSVAVVPEPGSLTLALVGVAAVVGGRWFARRRAAA